MAKNVLQSPDEIGDHLRVTAVPTYLLAAAIIILLGAFIVWGFLGNVSDKAYYSGVVFPVGGHVGHYAAQQGDGAHDAGTQRRQRGRGPDGGDGVYRRESRLRRILTSCLVCRPSLHWEVRILYNTIKKTM